MMPFACIPQRARNEDVTLLFAGRIRLGRMPNTALPFRGDHITLAQAVKLCGLAGTGGQAKGLIRAGVVRVNDVVERRPGRKLVAGDRIQGSDETVWLLEPG